MVGGCWNFIDGLLSWRLSGYPWKCMATRRPLLRRYLLSYVTTVEGEANTRDPTSLITSQKDSRSSEVIRGADAMEGVFCINAFAITVFDRVDKNGRVCI